MIEKFNNSLRYLLVVSLSLGIYSHIKSKSLEKITNELINERNKFNELNNKYQELLQAKLTENEIAKIISNEKIQKLIEEMNIVKSKISKQNLLTESDVKNVNNTDNIIDQLSDVNQKFQNTNNDLNSFIDVVQKYVNSKNNNFIPNSFTNLINDLNNIINSMTVEQNLAFITISCPFTVPFVSVSLSSLCWIDAPPVSTSTILVVTA